MSTEEKKQEDRLPVEVRAQMLQKETSIYFNLAKFEHAQRIATLFASSTMVPQHFQGNVANCLIALNYADRLQADPFMVLQNMYVVHGRPGVEAKLVIALINQSGKYAEPLKYKFDGSGDDYGCTAWTREAKSGEVVEGPKVSWKMVKAEQWDQKSGTKWKTIPDLMFRYRAASWFANVHCPELKLGMQTVEEINDFVELRQTAKGKYAPVESQVEAAPVFFEDVFADQLSDPLFTEWFDDLIRQTAINYTTKDKKCTEEQAKAESLKQAEQIKALFKDWKSKQPRDNPTTKPADAKVYTAANGAPLETKPDTTPTFRDEWINLKGPGYSTCVFKNLPKFKELEGELHNEAVAKWQKLYPEAPCPFATPVAPENVKEATQEPRDDEIINTMHPDSDDPMKVELDRLRAEIAHHDRVHGGYAKQARSEMQIGLTYTPANIDGCRVLLERIEAMLRERPLGGNGR